MSDELLSAEMKALSPIDEVDAAASCAPACVDGRPAGVPEGAAWRPFEGERPSPGDGDIAVQIAAKVRKLQQRVKKERPSVRLFVVHDALDGLLRVPKSQPAKFQGLMAAAAASVGLLRVTQGAFRSTTTLTGEYLWLDNEAWKKAAGELRKAAVEWDARVAELRSAGGCRQPLSDTGMNPGLWADADRAEAVVAVATILRSLLTFLKGTK